MTNNIPPILDYFDKLTAVLGSISATPMSDTIELIQMAGSNHKNVFVIGNGGSCSTADHFVLDLSKNVPYSPRCYSLSSQPAITAWANDTEYKYIYREQLKNLSSWGDLLIGISTSGNSKNIIEAARWARKYGLTVIGLTAGDGGELRPLLDYEINVSTETIERAEDAHMAVLHCIIHTLKNG